MLVPDDRAAYARIRKFEDAGWGDLDLLTGQASHSRAPLAVGVVRSEPVISDRVSLSLHLCVTNV